MTLRFRTLRVLIPTAVVAILAAGVLLGVSAHADTGGTPNNPSNSSSDHPDVATVFPRECDGRPVNITVDSDGKVVLGTAGDDVVAVASGGKYASGGGVDVVCSLDGRVDAVITTDSGAGS